MRRTRKHAPFWIVAIVCCSSVAFFTGRSEGSTHRAPPPPEAECSARAWKDHGVSAVRTLSGCRITWNNQSTAAFDQAYVVGLGHEITNSDVAEPLIVAKRGSSWYFAKGAHEGTAFQHVQPFESITSFEYALADTSDGNFVLSPDGLGWRTQAVIGVRTYDNVPFVLARSISEKPLGANELDDNATNRWTVYWGSNVQSYKMVLTEKFSAGMVAFRAQDGVDDAFTNVTFGDPVSQGTL